MAGTQGSSYGSSSAAAAGNRQVTSNLRSGLNASGSSRTNSGYGNTSARSSVNAAAANAARMAAERATSSASQRTASSGGFGGYGPSRPASANVNAAAARASMMNNQRSAGITQSAPGRGDAFGANQTVSKGVNMSAGDLISGGYGQYRNPTAGLAMAARPNTSVYNRGINLSSGDLLAGGYGSYRQAPSMQSTPQTAMGGWNDLAGLQRAVAGMNPTFGNIVAGTTRSPLGSVSSNGEIGSIGLNPSGVPEQQFMNAGYGPAPSQIAQFDYGQTPLTKDLSRIAAAPSPENLNWGGPPNVAASNAVAMNQAYNVNSGPKVAMEGGIPGAISPDSVPSLPNYAPSVSVAKREPSPYDPVQQMAGYQNPARAFPSRPAAQPTQTASLLSPMAGQGASFYVPTGRGSAQAYNDAMIGSISDARYQQAMAAPASSNDPLENPLYMGDSTPQQKVNGYLEQKMQKIASPVQKAGDYVNGLLGGSPYNDLYGRPGMVDPTAKDAMNNLAEKVPQIGNGTKGADQATQTEFKSLSKEDRKKVRQYMKDGLSMADAIKKVKGTGSGTGTGTGGGGTQTAALYYPQYYSTWAGLPSGQRYG